MALDEKDLKILKILMENSRASYNEIARAVGLSDVAVIKRVKRMEKEGVIRKYTVKIDPEKLGYKAVSITGIDVEPEHMFDVIEMLKSKDYVKYLAITSGDHSIIAVIWARDNDEMAKIHKEISEIGWVKRICPAIILDVIKE